MKQIKKTNKKQRKKMAFPSPDEELFYFYMKYLD
jgi:hypothetical protein